VDNGGVHFVGDSLVFIGPDRSVWYLGFSPLKQPRFCKELAMKALNVKNLPLALCLGFSLATTACWADEGVIQGSWSANQRNSGGLGYEIRCQEDGFCIRDFGLVLDTHYSVSGNTIVLTRSGISAEVMSSDQGQMRISSGVNPFLGSDLSGLVLKRTAMPPAGKNSVEGEWLGPLVLPAEEQRKAGNGAGSTLALQLAPNGQARMSLIMQRFPWGRIKKMEDGRRVIASPNAPEEVSELRTVADELQIIDSRGKVRSFNRLKF
jgi:hypothetical protein